MELSEYLGPIKQHLRFILLMSVCAGVAAGLLTLLLPEAYQATALVLVRPQEEVKVSLNREDKQLLNFPVSGAAIKAETPSNTYIEVIKSREIAEQVVRRLRLDTERHPMPTEYYRRWLWGVKKKSRAFLRSFKEIIKYGRIMGPSEFEKAVEDYQNSISLKAVKDTYIFNVSYDADYPADAAEVANTAASLFLDYMAQIKRTDAQRVLETVGDRLNRAEVRLTAASRAVSDFKEKHGTVNFKDEATEEIKLIAGLEADLEKADIKLAGLAKMYMPTHPQVERASAERTRIVAALAERRHKLEALPEKERKLADLSLESTVAEDIYQVASKEFEHAMLREALKISEMKVVSSAVAPFYPLRPLRYYYVIGGFVAALLIGVGFAFVSDTLNLRIQSVEQVERDVQLRVLATLPPFGAGPEAKPEAK